MGLIEMLRRWAGIPTHYVRGLREAIEMCARCNQNPRFEWRGKTYQLCAVCSWEMLQAVFRLPDDASRTAEQKVAEAVDYVPFGERNG